MSIQVWQFPLTRPHTGVLLGNGVQGLMVWGADDVRITVGRAGFWDHRGGNRAAERATYADVRRLLEAGDEAGLKALFAPPAPAAGQPARPQHMNLGRVDLRFSGGFRPVVGRLNLKSGVLRIELQNRAGASAEIVLRQSMEDPVAWVELDEQAHGPVEIVDVPAWEYVCKELLARGCEPPVRWRETNCGGFCQHLPADDACALAWYQREGKVIIATALGLHAEQRARALAAGVILAPLFRAAARWWNAYYEDAPELRLPDATLQDVFEYGLYKQACLTTPGGVAATLQGPFMEEYQLPPWSNDYHFNINLQLIYWPCLATGKLAHFLPLWEMLRGWLPRLKELGEHFFGVPGALMLPHAVDDRCQIIGSFWTGTIDHACTAWIAYLAWLHYRYSMDVEILKTVAWPLLNGAFNGFYAMLEEQHVDGRTVLSLPVSVSPEYNGARMDAWGRNASFQLAALHRVAAILPQAAAALGEPEDPRWATVRDTLPPYTTVPFAVDGVAQEGKSMIGLWEGQALEYSHRHHSHLAALYPFCTIDPHAPEHRGIVAHSLWHWTRLGAGQWTGWSIPWAAAICARCGLADAAVAWLHWWHDVYTNYGHGTTHNADCAGCTSWDDGSLWQPEFRKVQPFPEVMQMDAGMGALTAVLELLVQCRDGVIYVLPRIPSRWHELTFDGIHAEGAFVIGATVERYQVRDVRVTSLLGGTLELVHGMPACELSGKRHVGPRLTLTMRPGQKLLITRTDS